ncbi:alpha/beta fold hydrolase [Halovenus rubra]|uniref:Alpha/beta fold hydrolase n=2 Tax=Halovenus rubra TaxID=869890 RepID=A0ABD5X674_9EURY|nr:alpha/beta hydrolase [Halovenus rubra]
MQQVDHDGRTTMYRATQSDTSGPTALYIHGSGGNHQLWAHQYAPTGPTHPAVAVDLSGHGTSGAIHTEPGQETLNAYARDVTAVARETDADILIGNSLGGAVVFEVLLNTDFDADGVVFAGTGAKLAVNAELRELLVSDFNSAIEQLHQPSMLFADAGGSLLAKSKETLQKTGQQVTTRDFLTCHEFDVREQVAEIDLPALAVVGADDRLTPPLYHEFLADTIDSCETTVLKDAGHLAMLERPEAFNQALSQFITEHIDT